MHQPAGYGKDCKGNNRGESWPSLASAHCLLLFTALTLGQVNPTSEGPLPSFYGSYITLLSQIYSKI